MNQSSQIQVAIQLLDLFFASRAPFDIILAKFFKKNKIGSHDRRAIAEFCYSIFRNFEKLKFLTQKITSNFGRFYILAFLKTNEKWSNDKINETFSGKQYDPSKLTDFEKRFLSSLDKNIAFPENALFNYSEWMSPYLKRSFGKELSNEMSALNGKATVDLRVNTLKASKDEVKQALSDLGFQVEDCRYSTSGLKILRGRIGRNCDVISKGLAEIQDEGSQLVAEACGTVAGDTVVDYCAGAGGKTLAIAATMKNKGRIFALDKYEERLENAKLRFRRAGVNNAFCQQITGKWIKRRLEFADIVLVDAPCSGTGTWRRNPDMRAKFAQEDLQELLAVQAEILESAYRLVKKGGRLVYATCSILKEENEDQVAKFLENHSDFSRVKVRLQNYSGDYLKLTPYQNKTDGFFAAVLERAGA
ncbi:MAG: RsmB/NOP family class I SAM-dependent RNA methyltransferase [Holosporaceae bacterium]|jgi:16S rRNA (cytosine967-C5)-methyltransferase|nr:RsmB/NOP family class I SAM-dependent RNA methyltransferase [Holosporaceae bacterium]